MVIARYQAIRQMSRSLAAAMADIATPQAYPVDRYREVERRRDLHPASRRAASMYWNGIGDVAIGFARDGAVLPETGDALPIGDDGADRDAAAAFAGLDTSVHGTTLCGLLSVERFTGMRIDGEPPPVATRYCEG